MSERVAANKGHPGTKIRDGVPADVPELVQLLADDALGATREQTDAESLGLYRQAMEEILAQGGNRVLVAELDAKIVGCLQLTIIPGLAHCGARRAQIEAVRVSSRLRGHGLGEVMMREAITIAEQEQCRMVQLTTDRTRTDAHRFYERLGFEVTHLGLKLKLGEGPGPRE